MFKQFKQNFLNPGKLYLHFLLYLELWSESRYSHSFRSDATSRNLQENNNNVFHSFSIIFRQIYLSSYWIDFKYSKSVWKHFWFSKMCPESWSSICLCLVCCIFIYNLWLQLSPNYWCKIQFEIWNYWIFKKMCQRAMKINDKRNNINLLFFFTSNKTETKFSLTNWPKNLQPIKTRLLPNEMQ